jgi:hypothetical protein
MVTSMQSSSNGAAAAGRGIGAGFLTFSRGLESVRKGFQLQRHLDCRGDVLWIWTGKEQIYFRELKT